MSKSGIIQSTVAAIAGIAIVVWLQLSVFNISTIEKDEPLDNVENSPKASGDAVQQAIKILNSSCPRTLDEQTRLDSASYLSGNVFAEYFTLTKMNHSSIDTASLKPRIEATIINSLKTNPAYDIFRKYNVTFMFIYKDLSAIPIFNITITPAQYNN